MPEKEQKPNGGKTSDAQSGQKPLKDKGLWDYFLSNVPDHVEKEHDEQDEEIPLEQTKSETKKTVKPATTPYAEESNETENDMKMNDMEASEKLKVKIYLNAYRKESSKHFLSSVGQEIRILSFPTGIALLIEAKVYGDNIQKFWQTDYTLKQVFNGFKLNMNDYVEADKLKYLNNELDEGRNPFLGTNILFGEKEIYILKEKDALFWTPECAKQDVKNIFDVINRDNKKAAEKEKLFKP
jgi:hypothetical protein